MGFYQNCIAKGNVSGSWSVGGFAGVLFFESDVDKCASYGKVTASDWNVGGFAGYVESDVEIKNSVAFGDVESIVTDFEQKLVVLQVQMMAVLLLKVAHLEKLLVLQKHIAQEAL